MLPDFGEIIRKRRKEHGLTIEQLAEKADVSDGLISLLERKKLKDIKISNLQKISEALKLDISDFFTIKKVDYYTLCIINQLSELSMEKRKKILDIITKLIQL